jgi:ferredoxin-type protein NapG
MADNDGNMSRRDLFRGAFLRATAKPSNDTPNRPRPANAPPQPPLPDQINSSALIPLLRPPCAVDEASFLSGCTRCNKCIEACPHDAIGLAPDRFRSAAGTPYIEPLAQPCWMCPDTPCVSACEPGVLLPQLPLKMADAVIQEPDCLAHQDTFCTVCLEHCPVEGALTFEYNVPIIHQETCTGCGVCQHVCPAPVNAILILPLRDRPSAPVSGEPSTEPTSPTANPSVQAEPDDDDDVLDPLRGRFSR